MNSACRCDFSTHITEAAPRLKLSRLNAPEPANNSKTLASTTRAPSELNTACLTRSGVGRTSSPFGTFRIRRAALPPVMRMNFYGRDELLLVLIFWAARQRRPTRLLKNLGEELLHVRPRTLVGAFVVGRAFGIVVARHRLREAVDRAAVFIETPVDLGFTQFFFKRGQIFRRLRRIIRAVAREDFTFDILAVGRRWRIKAAVKTDNTV